MKEEGSSLGDSEEKSRFWKIKDKGENMMFQVGKLGTVSELEKW
jgi:hypothetical protein